MEATSTLQITWIKPQGLITTIINWDFFMEKKLNDYFARAAHQNVQKQPYFHNSI